MPYRLIRTLTRSLSSNVPRPAVPLPSQAAFSITRSFGRYSVSRRQEAGGRQGEGKGTGGKWDSGRWPARYTTHENEWRRFSPKLNSCQAMHDIYCQYFSHRFARIRTPCPPLCHFPGSITRRNERRQIGLLHCDTKHHSQSLAVRRPMTFLEPSALRGKLKLHADRHAYLH